MRGPAALLALAALAAGARAQMSQNLTERIAQAIEAQQAGDTLNTTSRIIDLAPAAFLTAGTGDLDTTGACAEDINIFCKDVRPGAAHLAECIGGQIADDLEGTSEFTGKVSEACQGELLLFKLRMSDNINLDVKTAAACKFDAQRYCAYVTDLQDYPGKVIACLRENKDALRGTCAARIDKVQAAVADDFRLDAMLHEACNDTAAQLCGDVTPGGGRVNGCLRDHRAEITDWDCLQEMFRADVEDADDIRLSVRLFQACLPEKRKFCREVAPGHARAKDCLEAHEASPGFGDACRQLLDRAAEERSRDFRLDYHMRTDCKQDINTFCEFEKKALETVASADAKVIMCLQDFRHDLTQPACRKAVHRAIARGSEDIRFAAELAKHCAKDREQLCKNLEPGSARVIRCLQDAREQLSPECGVTLFDQEVMMSESIEFNAPMARACADEVATFCEGVPAGDARVLWCLQQHKDDGQFGKGCRDEVARHERNMGRDYRLNWRLHKHCDADTKALCADVCDGEHHACGGKVLRCLMDKKKDLKHEACRSEVFYFARMDVNTFGNDIILAEACRDDVSKLCSKVQAGHGALHDCLREHRQKLSAKCRKEEFRLEIEESSNFELRTSFMRACAEERATFCENVQTGGARVFRCLVTNLGAPDFGSTCRAVLVRKLQRRQENWRLDADLATACADAAQTHCGEVDHESDTAETTRCLIAHGADLDEACHREVARVVHMALFVWQPKGALSSPCDDDAVRVCNANADAPRPHVPGSILACLESSVAAEGKPSKRSGPVAGACRALVELAEPPDAMEDYDNALQRVAAQRLHKSLTRTGMWDKRQGVTITGYSALFCFSALVTTLLMGLRFAYKRWRGVDDRGYARVVKQGDV